MLMSMVMTSGFRESAIATAWRPSFAWPTTCNWSSALKIVSSTLHMNAESSTMSTRNFLLALVTIALSRHRHDRACRLRPHQLFHRDNQLIFLHGLRQESCRAFLHGAVAVFRASARSHHHHRNAARRRALPQLRHQLITRHARHLEVGNDQMAAVERYELRRFQPVAGQHHAVAVFLQHAPDEFPDADGIVCHHN